MKKYHPYVFNKTKKLFVGQFEKMYSDEAKHGFDSWHERDLRPLRKQISNLILSQYNFQTVLEIGCGKGTFTQLLKKQNNHVVGIDLSETAVRKAGESFPDITFIRQDINRKIVLTKFDLVVIMAVLAYIKNWKSLIKMAMNKASYCFVGEYIPKNPLGYVRQNRELECEILKYGKILTKVHLDDHHFFYLVRTKRKTT